MRKLHLGIAVSAAVHIVALAWLGTSEADSSRDAELAPTQIEIVEVVPPKIEVAEPPMQVAVLDEPRPTAADPRERPQIAAIREHDHAAIETTAPGASSGSNRPEPIAPHNPLMDMRRPRLDIKLPGHYGDLDHVPQGTVPVPEQDLTTGHLAPAGNGELKSNQGEFVMTVERDGTAHIKDEKNFHMGMRVPTPKDIGNGIREWQQDPTKFKDQQIGLGTQHTIGGDDKPGESNVVGIPLVGGGFDITDSLMRGHGQDPYASKKLHILDATRDERVQIGNKRRHEILGRANQLMQQNLDQMWASVTDPAGRKQALFELWDESAETGSTDLVEAGAAARKLVIAFIRGHLAAGSAHAYTAAELTAFNGKKQSKAKFAPYD